MNNNEIPRSIECNDNSCYITWKITHVQTSLWGNYFLNSIRPAFDVTVVGIEEDEVRVEVTVVVAKWEVENKIIFKKYFYIFLNLL